MVTFQRVSAGPRVAGSGVSDDVEVPSNTFGSCSVSADEYVLLPPSRQPHAWVRPSKNGGTHGAAADARKGNGVRRGDRHGHTLQSGGHTGALKLLHRKYEQLRRQEGCGEGEPGDCCSRCPAAPKWSRLHDPAAGAGLGPVPAEAWRQYRAAGGISPPRRPEVMDMPAARIRVAVSSLQSSPSYR